MQLEFRNCAYEPCRKTFKQNKPGQTYCCVSCARKAAPPIVRRTLADLDPDRARRLKVAFAALDRGWSYAAAADEAGVPRTSLYYAVASRKPAPLATVDSVTASLIREIGLLRAERDALLRKIEQLEAA